MDIINLPANKVVLGDCLKTIRSFPDKCIDLTVTSPPYDNLMTYKTKLSQKEYRFDATKIIGELFRITKDGGIVVWVVGDATLKGSETGSSFCQALRFKEVGFNLHDTMIWLKTNPMPSFKAPRYNQAFEYMFVLSKGTPKTFNPIQEKCKGAGGTYKSVKVMGSRNKPVRRLLVVPKKKKETKNLSNVWPLGHAARNYGHPAVFPESLAERHILTWSNKGDIILDLFMGSGTTAVMAIKNDRNYIGCEISKSYKKITEERIKEFLKSKGMVIKNGNIEWEAPFFTTDLRLTD
jgi:DNA modification methylase